MQAASGPNAYIAGVFQFAPNADQPQVRVRLNGISWVTLGAGGCTRGNPITSDANGNGIVAAPAAGVNNFIVGYALGSGVQGQQVPVQIIPQRIQG
jgi:hypothetical protein